MLDEIKGLALLVASLIDERKNNSEIIRTAEAHGKAFYDKNLTRVARDTISYYALCVLRIEEVAEQGLNSEGVTTFRAGALERDMLLKLQGAFPAMI
jgi:hypothetical protein